MVRLLICSLLGFALCSCVGTTKKKQEQAKLHFKIGTGYLNTGRYPQALQELKLAAELDPKNPQVQNNLGLAFFVRQKYTLAEGHLRKAVKLDPSYTEARNNLGRVLLQLELYPEALEQLEIAARDLTYKHPEKTLANLGVAYFKNKKFKQAAESLKSSLKIRRKHCLTSNYYARSLFELKKYQASSLAFDQATEYCKNENLDEPYFYAAMSYFRLKQIEEAITRFEEVIEKFPQGSYTAQASEMLKIIREKR